MGCTYWLWYAVGAFIVLTAFGAVLHAQLAIWKIEDEGDEDDH